MARSLKDALLKAGLNSSKNENERTSAKGRERKAAEKHQHTRNFCEHCEGYQPDVERYKHHNPTTDAQWICVACADKLMISDDCRASNQSDFARQGNFIRYFGHTKKFDQNKDNVRAASKVVRNKNGNLASKGSKKPYSERGPRKGHAKKRNFNS